MTTNNNYRSPKLKIRGPGHKGFLQQGSSRANTNRRDLAGKLTPSPFKTTVNQVFYRSTIPRNDAPFYAAVA